MADAGRDSLGWRRALAVVALAVALLANTHLSGKAYGYPYVPDPAFGNGGTLDLMAAAPADVISAPADADAGADGMFYVLFAGERPSQGLPCDAPRYVARYLANGSLDRSFGTGGFVAVRSSPIGCNFPSLAVDRNNRPLLTWGSEGPWDVPSSTLAITRFTTKGAVDPSFGSAGFAMIQIPCPGGIDASVDFDFSDRLVLAFGCRADELAYPEPASNPFRSYMGRLRPNGFLDTSFGGGIVSLPFEPGWRVPWPVVMERDGSAILAQSTHYLREVPTQTRLLRIRPDGTLAAGYQARVERSLRQAAAFGAPRVPEEANDFLLRRKGDLLIGGDASRGGWVVSLKRDGSLNKEFSDDGYRRFEEEIGFLATDPNGDVLAVGTEWSRLRLYQLQANGHRNRAVGGPGGQIYPVPLPMHPADLVSMRNGRPLFYFRSDSCGGEPDCVETAELRRLVIASSERLRPFVH